MRSNIIAGALAGLIGLGVGYFVGKKLTTKEMEKEIEIAHENTKERVRRAEEELTKKMASVWDKDVDRYIKPADVSVVFNDNEVEDDEAKTSVDVINPRDKGSTGFEIMYLQYYTQDNVLATQEDEMVSIDDVIGGEDTLARMGEYEEDILCVRNYELGCDIEVSSCDLSFHEVSGYDGPIDEG